MKKKINGSTVSIDNIDLFINAVEGMKKPELKPVDISVTLDVDIDKVNTIISGYNSVYQKFPYPLYSMEIDLKYAVLGRLLRDTTPACGEYEMWVSDGLCIQVDTDTVLHFQGKTYTFEPFEAKGRSINLLQYKDTNGYQEFLWIYDRILEKKSTTEFYKVFFKDLVSAVTDSQSLKHELRNMLNFAPVPARMSFRSNTIQDVTRNRQYILDIYTDKEIPTKRREIVINPAESKGLMRRDIVERVYDFTVFAKDCKDQRVNSADMSRMYRTDFPGLAGLFKKIVGQGTVTDSLATINYKAVVQNNTVMFELRGRIYTCAFDKYENPQCLLQSGELYAVNDKGIYLIEKEKLASGVVQECIYLYDTKKKQMVICRVDYSAGGGENDT